MKELSDKDIGDHVMAIVAYGIYKEYKEGLASHRPVFFTTNKPLAKWICDKLDKLHNPDDSEDTDERLDTYFSAEEGYEWSAYWDMEPCIVLPDALLGSKNAAKAAILAKFKDLDADDETIVKVKDILES